MIGFDKPGHSNTEKVLEVLRDAAGRLGIGQVVVASTYGNTGLDVARLFEATGTRVVVVTHNVGFREPGKVEMTGEMRSMIEATGARVHTGTMVFRNLGTAIRDKMGYSQQDLVANTLRVFGQGMKVCVEIVLMASDAGLITPEDVLAVAGTGRGADTLVLVRPATSNRFFDLKVREVLAKPVDW